MICWPMPAPLGRYDTADWRPNELIEERLTLAVPPDWPDGWVVADSAAAAAQSQSIVDNMSVSLDGVRAGVLAFGWLAGGVYLVRMSLSLRVIRNRYTSPRNSIDTSRRPPNNSWATM